MLGPAEPLLVLESVQSQLKVSGFHFKIQRYQKCSPDSDDECFSVSGASDSSSGVFSGSTENIHKDSLQLKSIEGYIFITWLLLTTIKVKYLA